MEKSLDTEKFHSCTFWRITMCWACAEGLISLFISHSISCGPHHHSSGLTSILFQEGESAQSILLTSVMIVLDEWMQIQQVACSEAVLYCMWTESIWFQVEWGTVRQSGEARPRRILIQGQAWKHQELSGKAAFPHLPARGIWEMALLVLGHNLFPSGDKHGWHTGSVPFTALVINLELNQSYWPCVLLSGTSRLCVVYSHPRALLFMTFIESSVKS